MAKNRSPEHDAQVALVDLIKTTAPDILFTATVGGVRLSINQAKRMKAAGYLRGVPDLLFFEPREGFAGLAIELKAKKGGRVSPDQRSVLNALKTRNWRTEVAHGYDHALSILRDYFEELAEL